MVAAALCIKLESQQGHAIPQKTLLKIYFGIFNFRDGHSFWENYSLRHLIRFFSVARPLQNCKPRSLKASQTILLTSFTSTFYNKFTSSRGKVDSCSSMLISRSIKLFSLLYISKSDPVEVFTQAFIHNRFWEERVQDGGVLLLCTLATRFLFKDLLQVPVDPTSITNVRFVGAILANYKSIFWYHVC